MLQCHAPPRSRMDELYKQGSNYNENNILDCKDQLVNAAYGNNRCHSENHTKHTPDKMQGHGLLKQVLHIFTTGL
jgi:hypothetical protein